MSTELGNDRRAPHANAPQRPGSLVLVCEAQASVGDALREVLYGVPGVWRAARAASVSEARQEAARLRPDVAVVTTHVGGGDAIAAARAIKGEVPGCVIMLVAATEDVDLLLRGARLGVRGYLTMRSQVRDFIRAVESLLRGAVAIPPELMGLVWDDLITSSDDGSEDSRLARLSGREREVLSLLAEGGSRQSIATDLYISPDTARTHLQHIFAKLGVRSKLEAVSLVVSEGWMPRLVQDHEHGWRED